MKIQIKSIKGDVLFEHTEENNTIKLTVEKAVKDGVYLEEANLAGTDLEGADLEDANLAGADLNGTNLKDANLSSADLRFAVLTGTKIRNANFTGVSLEDVVYKNKRGISFESKIRKSRFN